jgi:hypothetical protein
MATPSQLLARIIDLFGPAGTAVANKLYGNLMVSPAGNVIVGSLTDDAANKFQVTGATKFYGSVAFASRPSANGNVIWDTGNLTPANYAPLAGATFTGYVIAEGMDPSGGGQLRINYGTYDTIFRNDGTNMYFMSSSSAGATYNSFRPFAWNLSNGAVAIDGSNAGVVVGTPAASSDYFVVNGVVCTAYGYRCHAGEGGVAGNVFNFNWSGNTIQAWIDGTNVGTLAFTSDARVKQNVVPSTKGLDRLLQLRTVSYEYQDEGIFVADGRRHEGFITQEVQELIPSAVHGEHNATHTVEMEDGETKTHVQPQSLVPLPLIAVTVQAVQELHAIVEQQGAVIQALQETLNAQAEMIAQLQAK